MHDLAELTDELWAPEKLSAAGIGPDQDRFEQALSGVEPALVEALSDPRRGGGGGRTDGETVCGAV